MWDDVNADDYKEPKDDQGYVTEMGFDRQMASVDNSLNFSLDRPVGLRITEGMKMLHPWEDNQYGHCGGTRAATDKEIMGDIAEEAYSKYSEQRLTSDESYDWFYARCLLRVPDQAVIWDKETFVWHVLRHAERKLIKKAINLDYQNNSRLYDRLHLSRRDRFWA